MAPVRSEARLGLLLLSALSLLSAGLVGAAQDPGTAIPAESRPCVDCHAFEFMQRALQDLKKTAYSLDTRFMQRALQDLKKTAYSLDTRKLFKASLQTA